MQQKGGGEFLALFCFGLRRLDTALKGKSWLSHSIAGDDHPDPLHINRRPHALIETVGQVGGAHGEHQLRDLFGVEMFAESVQIGLLN